MATLYWEVPTDHYHEAEFLVMEAHALDQQGLRDKLAEVVEAIKRFPGYPSNRTPDDLVVLVRAPITVPYYHSHRGGPSG